MVKKRDRFYDKINRTVFLIILLAALTSFGFASDEGDSDLFLKIYRGIDTYGKVYKEIALNYADTLNPEEIMRAGIDGMLKTLDPYTVYIGENESDEIDLITSGKYGGVGVTIGLRDGYVTIISLMEGFSAAKQGMEIGDRIIEIEGKLMKGSSLNDVRQLVRGVPGTELKMKIEREGDKKPIDFVLLREEISVKNITYTGYVADGIGCIRLERFSRTAGEDLRGAINELKAAGELKGLVLDLRDNPGGLLESSLEVVSKFVPEGSLVVSTRGRKSNSEKKYFSSEKPMLGNIPIVVLVNRYSASASEIAAGAIQDLDRGVILGTRSFGKGLVQTITRLSENSSLKITTARYYTPSGRCIQEVDYWHRDGDGNGTTMPDSLRHEFRTAHNRRVWEGGGILPDTVVLETTQNKFIEELYRKSMLFRFANHYAAKNKTIADTFEVTDGMIDEFGAFLKEKEFNFQDDGELKLKELRTIAIKEHYDKSILEDIDKLETALSAGKDQLIRRNQKEIQIALRTEILARMKGEKARFESTFAADKQLQTALGIIKNKKIYDKLLGIKGK